jgi:hypothetical protein
LRRRLGWLLSDAVLFARILLAAGPLGTSPAARALRSDRGRITCRAAESVCLWASCPLEGAHGSPGAPSCFLIGAP